MTNKATKYGLMTIAAVLLVAMAFAGAGAAVDVATWTDLESAISAGGVQTIYLTADIDATESNSLSINNNADITLSVKNGNHYLSWANANPSNDVQGTWITIESGSKLTLVGTDDYCISIIGKKDSTKYLYHYTMINVSGDSTLNLNKNAYVRSNYHYSKSDWSLGGTGGIDVYGTSVVNINGGVLDDCGSTFDAGGIMLYDNSILNLNEGGVISNCTSTTGGAIRTSGAGVTVNINGGSIKSCHAVKDLYNDGGGAAIAGIGTIVMNSGTIENCHAADGFAGGAIVLYGGSFTMNGGKIYNADSSNSGGAIYLYPSRKALFIMNGGTIENCVAQNTGAVVYAGKCTSVNNGNTVVINGGTITGCRGGGSLIDINANCTITITGGTISKNTNSGKVAISFYGEKFSLYGNPVIDSKIYIGNRVIDVTGSLDPIYPLLVLDSKASSDVTVVSVDDGETTASAVASYFDTTSSDTYLAPNGENNALVMKNVPADSSKVTFYDGESKLAYQIVSNGEYANPSIVPEKPFGVLIGWYSDSECTAPFDFATPITATIAIYGKWADTTGMDWYNNGVASGIFTITTATELEQFASLVNQGVTFAGQTVKLGADIDLSGKEWTPIGNITDSAVPVTEFKGTFDGNSKTISHLSITKPTTTGIGLFGYINSSVIKDLVLSVDSISGQRFVGSLSGMTKASHVYNVTVQIPNGAYVEGVSQFGGALGRLWGGCTIENVTVLLDGTVKCNESTTYSPGSIGQYAGGIIGATNQDTIHHILVQGTGSVVGSVMVGGAIGNEGATSGIRHNISVDIASVIGTYCVGGVFGELTNTIEVENIVACLDEVKCAASPIPGSGQGVNEMGRCFGGIVGLESGSTGSTGKINNSIVVVRSISTGVEDSRDNSSGGICGSGLTISDSISLANFVSGHSLHTHRIAGTSSSVSNCYAWDGMMVNGNLVVSQSVVNMDGADTSSGIFWNNQSFFEDTLGWDFDNVWKMNNGNDNYKLPVLKWQITPVSGDASYLIPITVTFDTQGGSAVDAQNISKGLNATRPADDPTKAGYVFENWYNESACTGVFDFTARLTADTTAYANWTVKTTNVIASDNKAEFGNDNVTAIHSRLGAVTKVLLENVSNVANSAVNFTADNTSVHIPSSVSGYNQEEISVFEINATADGTAKINVTITFNDAATATAEKDNVSFFHYVDSEWKPLNSTIAGQNSAEVLYTVETTSFSLFGIGLSSPITYTVHFDANGGVGSMADMDFTYDEGQNLTANAFQRYNSNFLYWTYNGTRYYNTDFVKNLTLIQGDTVVMKAQWETYSTGGSSSGSTYMGSNSASYTPTQQPTVKPTVAPTAAPTEQPATPTVIATAKPTTQATQQSPTPFVGLLAGLGAAAVLLRLRK